MKFAEAFATLPLGTFIRFSDGTPQPPKHHKKKLAAWEDRNATGRIMAKSPSKGRGQFDRDSMTVHIGTFESGGTPIVVFNRVFSDRGPDDTTAFEEINRLTPGSFAIISDSEHTGRTVYAIRSTRAAIEAEKTRGFTPDSYVIVEIDANGEIAA